MSTALKLTIAFIFFAFIRALAQDNLPQVYELTTDTTSIFKLDSNYSQLLEDPKETYTIGQVSSPAFGYFHPNNTSQTGVNRKVHTYWFRFRIHNHLGRDVQIYFDNYAKSMELFTPVSNAGWQRQLTVT